jgi:hypothetical protein
MKYLFCILSFIFVATNSGYTQVEINGDNEEYPVLSFDLYNEEDFETIDLPPSILEQFKQTSRDDISKLIVTDKPEDLELRGVQILLPRTNFFPPTRQSYEARLGLANIARPSFGLQGKQCNFLVNSEEAQQIPILELATSTNDIIQHIEDDNLKAKKFNPGQIYFFWGYNRGWHSKSDVTFRTSDGTFTIYDAHGTDRPSKEFKTYVNPATFSVPQYNFRLGYQLNPKWSIEGGMDHMKWVFDNTRQYQVDGEFSSTVFVRDPNDEHNLFGLSFDQVKESGDMRWLRFEHTDGYNYAFVASTYTQNLLTSRDEKWKLDGIGGAGIGLMIPRTDVSIHRDQWWNYDALNNKFKIAGYGVHAEGKLRISYKNMFAEASGRYTGIKIDNALVNDRGDRMEHTPIHSFQFIFGGGVYMPLGSNKPKPKPKL